MKESKQEKKYIAIANTRVYIQVEAKVVIIDVGNWEGSAAGRSAVALTHSISRERER